MSNIFLLFFFISSLVMVGPGCSSKHKEAMMIKQGSQVSIQYKLTVDGNTVDQSKKGEPFKFTQGSGEIILGLEQALSGLKKGDKKTVIVNPAEGYGKQDPQSVQKIPFKAFKDPEKLKVGDVVNGQAGGGPFRAIVLALDAKEITLDFNHPLAGKKLQFDVEIEDVQ